MKKAVIILLSLLTVNTASPIKTREERRAARQERREQRRAARQERREQRRKAIRSLLKKGAIKAKEEAIEKIKPIIANAIDRGSDVLLKKAILAVNKIPGLTNKDKTVIIKHLIKAESTVDKKLPDLVIKILEKDSFSEMVNEVKKIRK